MMPTTIVLVAVLAQPAGGVWVRADGREVPMRCPAADEYGARTRLPRGCAAAEAGVLYSVAADTETAARATMLRGREAQVAELVAQLAREQAAHRETRDAARSLAADLDDAADTIDELRRGRGGVAWGDALAGAGVGVIVGAGLAVAGALAIAAM